MHPLPSFRAPEGLEQRKWLAVILLVAFVKVVYECGDVVAECFDVYRGSEIIGLQNHLASTRHRRRQSQVCASRSVHVMQFSVSTVDGNNIGRARASNIVCTTPV